MSDFGTELYSSCDVCRERKLKCSKESPSCVSCVKNNWNCHYSPRTTRTPLTRSNLNAAEERIKELEAIIDNLLSGAKVESILPSVQPASWQSSERIRDVAPQPDISSAIGSGVESLPPSASGFDWAEHEALLGGLADGMAALSINPSGAGYLGATSSVAPLRVLLPTISAQVNSITTASADFRQNTQHSLSDRSAQNMALSYAHENSYLDAYFSHYHTTYPFLHEPTFRAEYNGMLPRPQGSAWVMLLNTVLALGAWCIGNDYTSVDDFYYRRVLAITNENSVFETGNLTLVQALLLLSNYTQKRNRPNTGWNYLGLAVRIAVSLGLHKEFPTWQIKPLEREMRRRVWWGLFIFDSGASITFGRPVLLPTKELMDVSEVLNIHEESLTATSRNAPHEVAETTVYTGLIAQSKFHLNTNSLHDRLISRPGLSLKEILELDTDIDEYSGQLPAYFHHEHILPGQPLGQHNTLLFSRNRYSWRVWNMKIMLLRPVVLRWSSKCKMGDFESGIDASEDLLCRLRCLQYAQDTIASISSHMSMCINSRLSTWYILYFLFQAALIPVVLLMTDPMNGEAQQYLQDILTARELIQRTAINNDLASRCLSILSQLCSPIFDAPVPQDVLLDPGNFEGAFAPESLGNFDLMEFGDWQNYVFEPNS